MNLTYWASVIKNKESFLLPDHVGLVKYSFLVINILLFSQEFYWKEILFFFLSLHLDLIAILQQM